jgi:hypothetical protein
MGYLFQRRSGEIFSESPESPKLLSQYKVYLKVVFFNNSSRLLKRIGGEISQFNDLTRGNHIAVVDLLILYECVWIAIWNILSEVWSPKIPPIL